MPPSSNNFPNDDLNKINSVPQTPPQFVQTPAPQTPPTIQPPSAPIYSAPPSRPKHTKLIVAIVLLIILIGAGAALVFAGVIDVPIPFLSKAPYDKNHVISGIAEGFSKIQSASYTTDISLRTKPKDPDAEVIPGSPVEGASSLLSQIDVVGRIMGSFQKSENDVDSSASISLNAIAESFSFDLSAETRKIKNDFYAILTKFPPLIPGLESIKGKWVKVSQNDLSQNNVKLDTKDASDFSKIFLDIADKDQLFIVKGDPIKEKIGDMNAYRYDLLVNRGALVAVYKDFTSAMNEKYGDKSPVAFSESTIAYLESQDTDKGFEYINRNISMSIWSDEKGLPIKYSFRMRYLPNTATSSETQLNISADIVFSDINKPVVIAAPTEALSFKDAYGLILGNTASSTFSASSTTSQ